MVGSSTPVNGQAGKYIITSGLSLPQGFAVNYSIQGWRAGGKSGVCWVGGQGGRQGNRKEDFFF